MASTPTRDLPEEFLAATRKSQDVMIRAIKTWVETVRTVTPKLPPAHGRLADRLPRLPAVTMPFADRLPKPEDVVASSYDFAEHLLAIQRKFAEDVLEATEPLIPGNARRAWKEATKGDVSAAAAKTVKVAKPAVTGTAKAAEKAVAETAKAADKAVAELTPKAPAPEITPKAPAPAITPKAPAAPVHKAPAARTAPKPAPAKSAPKAPVAPRTAPKPAAAKPAPAKPAPAKSAPKSTGAS